MWQTGRKAGRTIDRSTQAPEFHRRDLLPRIEPAPPSLFGRMRGIVVIAGRGARWVLVVLIIVAATTIAAESGVPATLSEPGAVAAWARIGAALASLAVIVHLRGQVTAGLRALAGGRRASADPFARLAAQTKAERADRR